MEIFTARENFKPEYISGQRSCESCKAPLHGTTALVVRWTNKKGKASLALCNDECWSTYDHNFWIERAAKRAFLGDRELEAIELLDARLPRVGEQI